MVIIHWQQQEEQLPSAVASSFSFSPHSLSKESCSPTLCSVSWLCPGPICSFTSLVDRQQSEMTSQKDVSIWIINKALESVLHSADTNAEIKVNSPFPELLNQLFNSGKEMKCCSMGKVNDLSLQLRNVRPTTHLNGNKGSNYVSDMMLIVLCSSSSLDG